MVVDAKEIERRRAVMAEAAARMADRAAETDRIIRERHEKAVSDAVNVSRADEPVSVKEAIDLLRSVGPVEETD